jgi:hypothetical protein
MRRLAVPLVALSLLAFTGAAAGSRSGPPAIPTIPGNWSHAEINVKINRAPHTLILDRGRITQASDGQVTLRELGTAATIPLSADTIIVFRGVSIDGSQLRRGLYAETMRIDGGAAVRVRETLRP